MFSCSFITFLDIFKQENKHGRVREGFLYFFVEEDFYLEIEDEGKVVKEGKKENNFNETILQNYKQEINEFLSMLN
jgi:hypothetical protein